MNLTEIADRATELLHIRESLARSFPSRRPLPTELEKCNWAARRIARRTTRALGVLAAAEGDEKVDMASWDLEAISDARSIETFIALTLVIEAEIREVCEAHGVIL